MRRSARGEQSAFSLFPFLAVLLCTMGAMVVLLVAMAHVSRQKAAHEAEIAVAQAEAAAKAIDSPERRQAAQALAEAQRFAEEVARLKRMGEDRLKDEQARLSGYEDHLRRLKEEAESLKAETIELIAVEQEHFDDDKVAKQELERLNELIGELEDEIDQMKHAATGRERRFAVVPLRDKATGTLRPPIYFECREDGLMLQPEGVKIAWEDLVAPQFNNPLAAASRAAARYYESYPEARAANEVGEPYPLLVVRPEGIGAYYRARNALEQVGADYGYQPIGEDWPVEYGEANPVLAQWVEEALDEARNVRRGLARIVPGLAEKMAAGGSMNPGTSNRYAGSGTNGSGTASQGIRVSRANPNANNPFEGLRIEGSLPSEGQPDPTYTGLSAGSAGGPTLNQPLMAAGGSGQTGGSYEKTAGPAGVAAIDPGAKKNPNSDPNQAAGQRTGTAADGAQQQAPANALVASGEASGQAAGQATAGAQSEAGPSTPSNSGQPNGSKRRRNQRSGVPMVRPIRVYVENDRVVVLPDRAQSPSDGDLASSNAQSIAFAGATSAQINEVIAALKRHADSWGIAGQGMYWDPRLVLNVAADGTQRADELRQLFEAAALKVQAYPVATATRPESPGDARAPR